MIVFDTHCSDTKYKKMVIIENKNTNNTARVMCDLHTPTHCFKFDHNNLINPTRFYMTRCLFFSNILKVGKNDPKLLYSFKSKPLRNTQTTGCTVDIQMQLHCKSTGSMKETQRAAAEPNVGPYTQFLFKFPALLNDGEALSVDCAILGLLTRSEESAGLLSSTFSCLTGTCGAEGQKI